MTIRDKFYQRASTRIQICQVSRPTWTDSSMIFATINLLTHPYHRDLSNSNYCQAHFKMKFPKICKVATILLCVITTYRARAGLLIKVKCAVIYFYIKHEPVLLHLILQFFIFIRNIKVYVFLWYNCINQHQSANIDILVSLLLFLLTWR